jgi:hypothetical protein
MSEAKSHAKIHKMATHSIKQDLLYLKHSQNVWNSLLELTPEKHKM